MDDRYYLRRGRPGRPSYSKGRAASAKRQSRYQMRRSLASLPQDIRGRLVLVWLTLMVGILGLLLHIFRLQIIDGAKLSQQAQGQQSTVTTPFVPRHAIVDRKGNALAIDQPVYTLYVHPQMFKTEAELIATQLSPLVDQSVDELLQLFGTSESGIRIDDRLSRGTAQEIFNLSIDGLDLEPHQQRYYPQDSLFSHIVGFVNVDREGQAGVEYVLQDQLERPVERLILNRTGQGNVLPEGVPESAIQHDDLQLRLTVDTQLQRMVKERLHVALDQYSTDRGTVIVMDANTGEIRAMVTEPTFDPNIYFEMDMENLSNWAVSGPVEPGSTFKPVNVAIALESGKLQPEQSFYDGGFIEVGGWTIKNADVEYGGHGQVSVTDILKYSSNVGMVQIMQLLEADDYYTWLKRLGLGELSGTDLPFESPGNLKPRSDFNNTRVERATTAFGQGFTITPIQTVQLHGAIANGGTLVTPHVVQGLYDEDGQVRWRPERPRPETLFSEETSRTVLEMMEVVVQEGTGKTAQIPGYRIAGKTGTAEKASTSGGYDTVNKITSFVGVFPVDSPRYVVMASIDSPRGSNLFGSTVAAPIVKSVMEYLIAQEAIPPSSQ
ncbi:MAG: penicillin-binding protein 2 [Elainellaceae cyanobacterium]